jgi:hypothetical protein
MTLMVKVAEPNVGLMADIVSTPAGADWLLTLHCCRWRREAGRLLWIGAATGGLKVPAANPT